MLINRILIISFILGLFILVACNKDQIGKAADELIDVAISTSSTLDTRVNNDVTQTTDGIITTTLGQTTSTVEKEICCYNFISFINDDLELGCESMLKEECVTHQVPFGPNLGYQEGICPSNCLPKESTDFLNCAIKCLPNQVQDFSDGRCICYDEQLCTPGQQLDCYTGPIDTKNVGICHDGKSTCVSGLYFSECEGQILPENEFYSSMSMDICSDHLDNNCNRKTDCDDDSCLFAPICNCEYDSDCGSSSCIIWDNVPFELKPLCNDDGKCTTSYIYCQFGCSSLKDRCSTEGEYNQKIAIIQAECDRFNAGLNIRLNNQDFSPAIRSQFANSIIRMVGSLISDRAIFSEIDESPERIMTFIRINIVFNQQVDCGGIWPNFMGKISDLVNGLSGSNVFPSFDPKSFSLTPSLTVQDFSYYKLFNLSNFSMGGIFYKFEPSNYRFLLPVNVTLLNKGTKFNITGDILILGFNDSVIENMYDVSVVDQIQKEITPDGGIISIGDATLNIPPGAVNETVVIYIKKVIISEKVKTSEIIVNNPSTNNPVRRSSSGGGSGIISQRITTTSLLTTTSLVTTTTEVLEPTTTTIAFNLMDKPILEQPVFENNRVIDTLEKNEIIKSEERSSFYFTLLIIVCIILFVGFLIIVYEYKKHNSHYEEIKLKYEKIK